MKNIHFVPLAGALLALSTSCMKHQAAEVKNASRLGGPMETQGFVENRANPNVPAALDEVWHAMRAEASQNLQSGCEPARYSPPSGVNYRGVVIMLHGFSACPQQYDILGPQLAKAGYEVFVPLNPGHGALPKSISPRVDNTDFVPTAAGGWGPFVARINEIAGMVKGEKILVGLSQGANVALRAMETAPTMYDKVVIFSAKLRNETSHFNTLFSNGIHILSIDEFILNMRNGWPKCEKDSTSPGTRSGFCNFDNRHAIAMLDFGDMVVRESEKLAQKGTKSKTAVQFVLSPADNGACNNAAVEMMKSWRLTGSSIKACLMPEGVPHSMFSAHDTPYEKPWRAPLFNAVQTFITQGTPVPGSSDELTDCKL